MKLKLMGVLVSLTALATYIGACNVEQPKPTCPVAHGAFIAKYNLKSGTGACAELKGEQIGMEKYNVPGTRENTVAIRAEGMGLALEEGRVDPADPEGKNANALGKLSSDPDPEGFCLGTDIAPARQAFEAIPEELDADGGVITEAAPARTLGYEWSNLKISSLPTAPGTQFRADLKYTEDGCTAQYEVVGVWPPVSCGKDIANPDGGDPLGQEPDESRCHPNPDAGIVSACEDIGVCLNAKFDVKCDPDLLYCVLAKAPPSFVGQ